MKFFFFLILIAVAAIAALPLSDHSSKDDLRDLLLKQEILEAQYNYNRDIDYLFFLGRNASATKENQKVFTQALDAVMRFFCKDLIYWLSPPLSATSFSGVKALYRTIATLYIDGYSHHYQVAPVVILGTDGKDSGNFTSTYLQFFNFTSLIVPPSGANARNMGQYNTQWVRRDCCVCMNKFFVYNQITQIEEALVNIGVAPFIPYATPDCESSSKRD